MRWIFVAVAVAVAGAGLSIFEASPTEAAFLSTGATNGAFGGYVCADVNLTKINFGILRAYDCSATANQQFEWNGVTIYDALQSTCVGALDGGTSPGTLVNIAPCNGTSAQQWYYHLGQIINLGSDSCLDAGNSANGTLLILNTCNISTNNQQWQIKGAVMSTGAPNGLYGGHVCADVRNANYSGVVQAYDCNAAPNQRFELNGYTIWTSGLTVLSPVGRGTSPGTKVDAAPYDASKTQQWYYGYGQIVNIGAELCLDAGNSTNHTQLIINTCTDINSQQWQLK